MEGGFKVYFLKQPEQEELGYDLDAADPFGHGDGEDDDDHEDVPSYEDSNEDTEVDSEEEDSDDEVRMPMGTRLFLSQDSYLDLILFAITSCYFIDLRYALTIATITFSHLTWNLAKTSKLATRHQIPTCCLSSSRRQLLSFLHPPWTLSYLLCLCLCQRF